MSAALPTSYVPLAPDPLPPGPRVTNPLAPLLRLLLRLFNVALAALSLLLITAALWMAETYRRDGGDSGGGSGDVPAPPPAPDAAAVVTQAAVAAAATMPAAVAAAAAAAAAQASFPWFIYSVGGSGAYCLAASLAGLAGVKRDRRWHLSAYIGLLAVLVLAQAGATLVLLTDSGWRERIPDDPSGRWKQALDFLAANARVARLVAVAALGAELAALGAACWLKAMYEDAYEAWLDSQEQVNERARAASSRAVQQTYAQAPAGNSRWRTKYNLEPSALEAATAGARQTAALQDDAF